MIKKFICGVINALSVLVIVAAIVVLCMVLLTEPGKPPNIFGYTMLRITTGSMEPTYRTDTLIVVKTTDPSKIKEGDVISFYSSDPALEGAVNTHRVVSISQDGDNYIYTTKGDANNAADLYDVQSRYLIGKVIWSSLLLGKLSRLAANPLIFIPLILIPLAAILITNLVHTIRLTKTIAREEEEAAVKEALRELRESREKKEKQNSDQSDQPNEKQNDQQ